MKRWQIEWSASCEVLASTREEAIDKWLRGEVDTTEPKQRKDVDHCFEVGI